MPNQPASRILAANSLTIYDNLSHSSQPWRVHLFSSFVLNGEVRYDGNWRSDDSIELRVYGWTYSNYRSFYDGIWAQGWRLYVLESHVLNGQVLYDAVWRKGTVERPL